MRALILPSSLLPQDLRARVCVEKRERPWRKTESFTLLTGEWESEGTTPAAPMHTPALARPGEAPGEPSLPPACWAHACPLVLLRQPLHGASGWLSPTMRFHVSFNAHPKLLWVRKLSLKLISLDISLI